MSINWGDRVGTAGADVVASSGARLPQRPRLRQDAIFAACAEGVYLQRPGDQFVLRGATTYRWIAVLAPKLTGEHHVDQLAEGLSAEHRRTLDSLLEVLAERGYLHDGPIVAPDGLPAEVIEEFGRQLGYVAHSGRDAVRDFGAFRSARMLVLGSPELVRATAGALLANGVAALHLAGADAATVDLLEAQAAALRARGCACTVRALPDFDPREALDGYDLVIGAGADLRTLLRINAALRRGAATTLLPVSVLGSHAFAGPLIRAAQGPCLECALLRQAAALPEHAAGLWRAAALGGRADADGCPAHLAAVLGALLAFEAFRWGTGVLPAETENAFVVLDTGTAESTREPVLAHPGCETCAATGAPPAGAVPQSALSGGHGGVFGCYTDADLAQSPVRTARLELPLPSGRGVRAITAFHVDTLEQARQRAVRAAACCYADDLGARHAGTSSHPEGERIAAAELLLHSGLSGEADGWLAATSLTDDRQVWVPAAMVFPAAGWARGLAEPTSAGTACASSATQATADGLLSALAFEGLCAALRGTASARRIPLPTGDAEVEFLVRAAAEFDGPLRVLDLPGAAPGFGCLAVLGDRWWALGAGHHRAEAMREALLRLLGSARLDTQDLPADTGDSLLRGFDPAALPVAEQQAAERAPTTPERIVGELGPLAAYAVDTTPTDLAAAGLWTTRVLLGRRDRRR